VVDAAGRKGLGETLRELWAFRDTTMAFAERDVRIKYKQTALGIGWAILQPVATVAIFAFAFGHVSHISGAGVPYAAFALSALVPWTFLQTAVTFSAESLLTQVSLVRKVYFPRETVVLGAVLACVLDLGIGLILFVVAGPALGAQVSVTWLLAPILTIPLLALAAGVGLIFAGLTAYYRDARYALPFLVQLWLFASPVAYPLSFLSPSARWVVVALNPAAGVLDSISRVLTAGTLPTPAYLSVSVAGCLVTLLVGYTVLKRLEPRIADVI